MLTSMPCQTLFTTALRFILYLEIEEAVTGVVYDAASGCTAQR